MKFEGSYQITAFRTDVWEAINDSEILRQCIPGCEEITRETPTDWTAKVAARIGPVKARFAGKIRLEDLQPPSSLRIVGEGNGGAAGFATGGALITLAEEGRGTLLTYEAEAQIGGKLAQIGSRLIDGFVRKSADDFFAKFAQLVSDENLLEASPAESADAPELPATSGVGPVPAVRQDARVATVPARRVSAEHPPEKRFDAEKFTIIILALLLVFMTIMYAMKA